MTVCLMVVIHCGIHMDQSGAFVEH